MLRTIKKAHFLRVALAATILGSPSVLNAQCHSIVACTVTKFITYDLKITKVADGDYNELSPVQVNYDFTATQSGISGADPANPTVWICPEFQNETALGGECKSIASPELGRTYHSSIMAISPWAGLNSKVRIVALKPAATNEDYGQRVELTSASAPLPTAAIYRINFDGFDLLTTRSTSTDTVWLDMGGMIKATPPHASDNADACKLAGFHWCMLANYYGDAHTSGYDAMPGRWIGDFRLTPEKEDDLRFWFSLYNLGNHKWEEIAQGVMDGFSKAGFVVLSAYGAASGQSGYGSAAGVIDDNIEKLHAVETASCDGNLASDVVIISNKSIDASTANTLDGLTRSTGSASFAPDYVYKDQDHDFKCDHAGSQYKIHYSVARTSWKNLTAWPE
jgi:hypothetical protein